MQKLIVYLSLPFLCLHLLVRFFGRKRNLFEQDQIFTRLHRRNPFENPLFQFAYFIVWLPEYRSSFYIRTGLVGRLMNLYLPGQKCLYIRTAQIGGGICVNHGHSTEINARSIGRIATFSKMLQLGLMVTKLDQLLVTTVSLVQVAW